MQRTVTISTAVGGTFATAGAGLSCDLCLQEIILPRGGWLWMQRVYQTLEAASNEDLCSLQVAKLLWEYTLHPPQLHHLWYSCGDQRSWIDSKGMAVCQVKSWTVSVQAQASARGRAGWPRCVCGQGLCSRLSWQPLRAALPCLCCQTSFLSLRLISASELLLFWLIRPGSHSKQ